MYSFEQVFVSSQQLWILVKFIVIKSNTWNIKIFFLIIGLQIHYNIGQDWPNTNSRATELRAFIAVDVWWTTEKNYLFWHHITAVIYEMSLTQFFLFGTQNIALASQRAATAKLLRSDFRIYGILFEKYLSNCSFILYRMVYAFMASWIVVICNKMA